jgi:hypothetical protein
MQTEANPALVSVGLAPCYPRLAGLTGTTIPSQYGFATVDVNGRTVMVTFYGDTDGDGHYNDVMDSFVLSGPSHAQELAPGTASVSGSLLWPLTVSKILW